MDAFVAHGDGRLHALQEGALGRPIPARTRTVERTADDDGGRPLLQVARRRVEDRHLLAARNVAGEPALHARHHQVPEPDVRERAPHHHLVVPAAGSVRVEVPERHAVRPQVVRGRRGRRDPPGGRDVIGCHCVAEEGETTGSLDVRGGGGFLRHPGEEGRLPHVGRGLIPRETVAHGDLQRVPAFVSRVHLRVPGAEHLRLHRRADGVVDLVLAGPDVAQEDLLAPVVRPQRLAVQVDVHPARERVGDDEGRRGEVVRARIGADAALEVPVPGEDRAGDEIVLADRARDLRRERSGVPDARRAAVADDVEAELLEVRHEAGFVEVFRHDHRAGSETRLHPRTLPETRLDGLPGQEARTDHDGRIRRVRATRDRGDDHGPVVKGELVRLALFVRQAHGDAGRRFGHRHAAVPRIAGPARHLREGAAPRARPLQPVERLQEARLALRQRHALLRQLRARDRRFDRGEVQLHVVAVFRRRSVRIVEEALGPRVGLDERHLLVGAAREAKIGERLRVDGEDRAGGAELGRHVAERRPVGERQAGEPRSMELDELSDDARVAEDLGHPKDEVRRGGAVRETAAEPEAEHAGDEHGERLPQHRRFGLDAAHAPPEDAETVHHRRMAVRADDGVGIGHALASRRVVEHDPGQVLEVHLVHDPRPGRDDLEVVERRLTPAEEGVALVVPLEFPLRVDEERPRRAERIHLHGVVDDEFARHQRVDRGGVAAEFRHRVAHRGQVHDGGHAGEVLQEDARGPEGEFPPRRGLRVPARDGGDVLRRHRFSVLVPDKVLQHHLDRERKTRQVAPGGGGDGPQVADRDGAAVSVQRSAGAEGIEIGKAGHGGPHRDREGFCSSVRNLSNPRPRIDGGTGVRLNMNVLANKLRCRSVAP